MRRVVVAAILFLGACDTGPSREGSKKNAGAASKAPEANRQVLPENLKPAVRRALTNLNLTDRETVQEALEKAGYVLISGKWQEKTPWKAALDNLHHTDDLVADQVRIANSNPALKWTFSRLVLKDDIPGRTDLGEFTDTQQQRITGKRLERFFSPKEASGSVVIEVQAPSPFYECSILAGGGVKGYSRKGSLKVTVTPEDGQPVELYSIVESEDKDSHDVTKEMRGKTRCKIMVEMQTEPDRYGDYARFLSCLPESKNVFVVGGCFLNPAPELDAIWEKAK